MLSDDINSILSNGVFIGDMFYKPEQYIPIRYPTRCYNCNRLGHTAKFCSNKVCCGKCSGEHRTDACTSVVLKCINCHGSHAAYDRNCPFYGTDETKNE